MRVHTVPLLIAMFAVAAIILGTPKLDVMLNESGTELLGVSFVKLTQPAIAQPSE